jgi:hypothetical protein
MRSANEDRNGSNAKSKNKKDGHRLVRYTIKPRCKWQSTGTATKTLTRPNQKNGRDKHVHRTLNSCCKVTLGAADAALPLFAPCASILAASLRPTQASVHLTRSLLEHGDTHPLCLDFGHNRTRAVGKPEGHVRPAHSTDSRCQLGRLSTVGSTATWFLGWGRFGVRSPVVPLDLLQAFDRSN